MAASALKARTWAQELAGPGENVVDNIFDAIRHAYWSATMTKLMGPANAKLWTDAHEWRSGNAETTCMDQHNNAVGRNIGQQAGVTATDATIRQLVLNAANQDDLQDAKGC